MPKWLIPAFVVLVIISFIPAAMISRARATKKTSPRINLIPDMDYQPKFLPQTENAAFVDRRAMRAHPEGTVARGQLREDDAWWRGTGEGITAEGEAVYVSIPARANEEFGSWEAMLTRGRSQFDVYCAVCHGHAGYGDGVINARAQELMEQGKAQWAPPTSLHDELVRARADGHLFNTITNGIRTMPAYGSQIRTEDRWAIVGYVRALQRSQRSSTADVPAEERARIRPQED